MLVEYLRVIRANKPNFGIYENVKNIVGKQFRETTFKMFEQELNEYGYNTYWEVLNAKNYGIPQNRERVYLIFVKKELDNGEFHFPKPFNNNKKLKDLLEKTVDERFYISKDKVKKFINNLPEEKLEKLENQNIVAIRGRNPDNPSDRTIGCPTEQRLEPNTKGVSNCLTSVQKDNMVLEKPDCIGNLYNKSYGTGYAGCVWNIEGISPALTTMQGGGRQPHIITSILSNKGEKFEKEVDIANTLLARDYKGFGNQGMNAVVEIPQATKKGYIECEIGGVADLSYPESKTRRGRVQENGNICPTLTATETGVCRIESPIKIRKLTPKECFRLMGFEDCDYEKVVEAGISNSQLYKQAGNSIVVDVLYYIFKELYKAMPYLFENLKLSSFFSGIGAFEKALDKLYDEVIRCQSI